MSKNLIYKKITEKDNKIINFINNIENIEYLPTMEIENIKNKYSIKIPFSQLNEMGIAFASLPEYMRTVTNTKSLNVKGLYSLSFPEGISGYLGKFRDGSGYTSGIFNEGNLVAQGRLNPINSINEVKNTIIPYNPTYLFLVAAFIKIEKNLDEIKETQKNILTFLQENKKSEMLGNVDYIYELTNRLKYNINNESFKNTAYIKIQDIKQDAKQKIIFYHKQIQKISSKNNVLNNEKNTKKYIEETQEQFKNYQLALYLYSFTSFLDILLLNDFNKKNISNIIEKIEKESFAYRELYTICYNKIEKKANSSIENIILNNIAKTSEKTAQTLQNISILEKISLDEKLIKINKKLNNITDKKIDKTLKNFIICKENITQPFIENINHLNVLYNNPINIYIDNNNIHYYLN